MENEGYLKFEYKRIAYAKWGGKEWRRRVPAYIRNYLFYIPNIEDKDLLILAYEILKKNIECCNQVSGVIDEMYISLEKYAPKAKTDDYKLLMDSERIRTMYLTQMQLQFGHNLFKESFDKFSLNAYPAWCFHRQAGAINNKRKHHVENEGCVKLKTDLDFWISMNDENKGGFGNPFGPWGFNSWMRALPESRCKVEKLGLLKKGEKIDISAAEREKWCLPLSHPEDINDAARLNVVKSLKRWGVWNIRKKIMEKDKEYNLQLRRMFNR